MNFKQICLTLCLVFGCSDGRLTPEARLKLLVPDAKPTVRVSGKVLVDGKPVPNLWVSLVPKGTKLSKDQMAISRGQTGQDGSFRITTYLEGDGAPAGDYSVIVEWLRFRQTGGQWIGPDKLNGRYSKPEKSKFAVTVGDAPVDVQTLELTSR